MIKYPDQVRLTCARAECQENLQQNCLREYVYIGFSGECCDFKLRRYTTQVELASKVIEERINDKG